MDQLEADMATLITEHESLLGLIRRKREAMRTAQPRLVYECCELENQRVQKIGRTEKHRQQVVAAITGLVNPAAKQPLTLEQIAAMVGEPRRGRLLVRRQQLRQLMQTVKDQNEQAGRITEGLLRHVQGMIQQVSQAIGTAGTYGRRGVSVAPAVAVSSFVVSG
jgi:hypothetical protein